MAKKKEKEIDCENLKCDRDKRDFIKKNLVGIGAVGVLAGVLSSPIGSAARTVFADNANLTNPLPISQGGTGNTTGATAGAYKLDGQDSLYYRCVGCSWTCTGTCIGACSGCSGTCEGACTNACTNCTGCTGGCEAGCTGSCSSCTGCTNCTGSCVALCASSCEASCEGP